MEIKTRDLNRDHIIRLASMGDFTHINHMIGMGAIDHVDITTTVIHCIRYGLWQAIDVLANFGVNIQLMVETAAYYGRPALVEKYAPLVPDLTQAILNATERGHYSTVLKLITRGAPIKEAAESAARKGDLALIETFLERGVDAGGLMLIAATRGHSLVMEKCMEYGATNYEKCMMAAGRSGHIKVLDFLDMRWSRISQEARAVNKTT